MSGPPNGRPARSLAAAVPALALTLSVLAACTGGSGPDREPAAPGPGPGSTSPSAAKPSVPLRTEVTHVAGRLSTKDRRTVAARVGRTISAYVDAAFLDGDYPRSAFGTSFAGFTPGAAVRARRDAALLTNQPLGPTTRSVRATRRTAYLSVLAPGGTVAGATAAVDLVFLVDRGAAPTRRVHLKGRLLMTRDRTGAWAIFGYHLSRSAAPVRSGS